MTRCISRQTIRLSDRALSMVAGRSSSEQGGYPLHGVNYRIQDFLNS